MIPHSSPALHPDRFCSIAIDYLTPSPSISSGDCGCYSTVNYLATPSAPSVAIHRRPAASRFHGLGLLSAPRRRRNTPPPLANPRAQLPCRGHPKAETVIVALALKVTALSTPVREIANCFSGLAAFPSGLLARCEPGLWTGLSLPCPTLSFGLSHAHDVQGQKVHTSKSCAFPTVPPEPWKQQQHGPEESYPPCLGRRITPGKHDPVHVSPFFRGRKHIDEQRTLI